MSMAGQLPARQQPVAQQQRQQQTAQVNHLQGHETIRTKSHQFSCLFTHQKTQKRKKWQDGRFVLHSSGHGKLYDACPAPGSGNPCLAEVVLPRNEIHSLLQNNNPQTTVEAEKYLIQLEGLWVAPSTTNHSLSTEPKVSTSMQKLMSRKFRQPGAYKPPNPHLQPQNTTMNNHHSGPLGKRRRPLQPGELVRQHYGAQPPPPQNHHHQQQHALLPPPAANTSVFDNSDNNLQLPIPIPMLCRFHFAAKAGYCCPPEDAAARRSDEIALQQQESRWRSAGAVSGYTDPHPAAAACVVAAAAWT